MHRIHRYSLLVGLIFLGFANTSSAFELAGVFSDHMVLQRNRTIPVWGKAQPGSVVIVNLDGSERRTSANSDGSWRVEFLARTASKDPIVLKASGDGQTVTISDILVGDIWFCSGQSNMGVSVSGAKNATEELKNANYPLLRLFNFPSGASWTPGDRPSWWMKDQTYPKWFVCSPATVGGFTAVGYVFGSGLLKKTDVPVGIINAAFGGALIEPFIPRDLIRNSGKFPVAQRYLQKADTITAEKMKVLEAANIKWNEDRKLALNSMKSIDEGWHRPNFNDTEWKTAAMPGFWQETVGLKADGVVWFRHTFNLDAQQSLSDRFSLGYVRIQVRTWINGVEVQTAPEAAGLSSIKYAIPAGVLKTGSNTIAIRIYNPYGPGGLKRINKNDFSLQQHSGKEDKLVLDLATNWRYKAEYSIPQEPMPLTQGRTHFTVPGVIYNAMIAPFTSFPVTGVVWYQGESNVSRADEYAELLPLLINTWRNEWKNPAMPFLIVQLPNYQPRVDHPTESDWAKLRAAQDKALSLPNTAVAVTYDAGEEAELHPRDKRTVAERLAFLAEEMVYHTRSRANAVSPRVSSATIKGKKIIINFDPVVKLKTADRKSPRGVAIAGADKKFRWAKASIKGKTLLIKDKEIAGITYIRYAWADNPDANLTSEAGLLVSPFEIKVGQ